MVRQQAQAEKLTLVVAENSTGYFGVYLIKPGRPKPYQAKVRRGGNQVSLGYFATAEEGQQRGCSRKLCYLYSFNCISVR
jgi:NADH:ubiquinone oxidoreductase subunit D